MDRTKWFINLESDTKADLNALAIGVIGEIMGDISTTSNAKVIEIARTLDDLEHVWNIKKTPTAMEVPQENSQPKCTINISKIEPLLDFPLIPLGPLCEVCDCFRCRLLHRCEIKQPHTLAECKYRCNGRIARNVCQYARKRGMINE